MFGRWPACGGGGSPCARPIPPQAFHLPGQVQGHRQETIPSSACPRSIRAALLAPGAPADRGKSLPVACVPSSHSCIRTNPYNKAFKYISRSLCFADKVLHRPRLWMGSPILPVPGGKRGGLWARSRHRENFPLEESPKDAMKATETGPALQNTRTEPCVPRRGALGWLSSWKPHREGEAWCPGHLCVHTHVPHMHVRAHTRCTRVCTGECGHTRTRVCTHTHSAFRGVQTLRGCPCCRRPGGHSLGTLGVRHYSVPT